MDFLKLCNNGTKIADYTINLEVTDAAYEEFFNGFLVKLKSLGSNGSSRGVRIEGEEEKFSFDGDGSHQVIEIQAKKNKIAAKSEIKALGEELEKSKDEKHNSNVIERLSRVVHNQWMDMAKNLSKEESLSKTRVDRWQKLFVPYDKLSEEMKEKDRYYARQYFKAYNNKKANSITHDDSESFLVKFAEVDLDSLKRLAKTKSISQDELAQRLGISKTTLRNTLKKNDISWRNVQGLKVKRKVQKDKNLGDLKKNPSIYRPKSSTHIKSDFGNGNLNIR